MHLSIKPFLNVNELISWLLENENLFKLWFVLCFGGCFFFFKYKTTIVILTCWALFYTKLKNCLHLEYEQNVIGKEIHNHIKTLCVKKNNIKLGMGVVEDTMNTPFLYCHISQTMMFYHCPEYLQLCDNVQ